MKLWPMTDILVFPRSSPEAESKTKITVFAVKNFWNPWEKLPIHGFTHHASVLEWAMCFWNPSLYPRSEMFLISMSTNWWFCDWELINLDSNTNKGVVIDIKCKILWKYKHFHLFVFMNFKSQFSKNSQMCLDQSHFRPKIFKILKYFCSQICFTIFLKISKNIVQKINIRMTKKNKPKVNFCKFLRELAER